MLSIAIVRFKFFIYLFLFCLTSFHYGKADDENNGNRLLNTSMAIYKKILKMRTLPFEDCGSSYDILYLSISSCSTIPCEMKRGSQVLVNVMFDDYGHNTNYLKHHVSWIFNAIKSDGLVSPDPCDGDHQCLKSSSDGKSYYSTVFVDKNFACIPGTMLWKATDDYGTTAICFRVPVVIIP